VNINNVFFIIQTIQFNKKSSNDKCGRATLLYFKHRYFITILHHNTSQKEGRTVSHWLATATVIISVKERRLITVPSAVILPPFSISVNAGLRTSLDWNWQQLAEKWPERPHDCLICSCYAANFLLRWPSQPCVGKVEMFTLFARIVQTDFTVKSFLLM
jgi:hypothetical protein